MNYLTEMYVRFMNSMKSEKGQGLVEYALILVLVALAVILVLSYLSGGINSAFSKVNSALNTAPTGGS